MIDASPGRKVLCGPLPGQFGEGRFPKNVRKPS